MNKEKSNKDLFFQIDTLDQTIDSLWRGSIILNLLHTRTDLDRLETSELKYTLEGIERLINLSIDELENRSKYIREVANG